MSSTNRSASRDSHIADYYVTPIPDIKEFIDAFLDNHPEIDLSSLAILDPCAGGNPEHTVFIQKSGVPGYEEVIPEHPMSYPTALESYGVKSIVTNNIRPDSPARYHIDILEHTVASPGYNLVITNPPFNLALDIIKKSLEFCKEDGYVIMLLRLNFFGSKARKSFFDSHMPIETYVHHKRISFAKGATDSIEYMHCVWKKGHSPKFTKLYLI